MEFDKISFPRGHVYDTLRFIVSDPNFVILPTLLENVETIMRDEKNCVPGLYRSIVFILFHSDALENTVRWSVEEELRRKPANSIFAENCLASSLVQNSFMLLGQEYLRETFGEVVDLLLASNVDLEINPTIMKEEGERKVNRDNLKEWAEKFFQKFFNSLKLMHPILRNLCKIINERMSRVYAGDPNATTLAKDSISTFLLSRFITLALVSPKEYGIVRGRFPLNAKQHRNLGMVAKMFQGLALGNSVPSYLDEMNDWIDENLPQFYNFFDAFLSETEDLGNFVAKPEELDEIKFEEEAGLFIKFFSESETILPMVFTKIMERAQRTSIDESSPILESFAKFKWLATNDWFAEFPERGTKALPLPTNYTKTLQMKNMLLMVATPPVPKRSKEETHIYQRLSEDWLQPIIKKFPFTILLFFRGGFDVNCRRNLREWERILPMIQSTGGSIYGICSEDQDSLNELQEKLDLGFDLISDFHLDLVDLFNVEQDASPIWSELGRFNASKGFISQPAVVVLSQDRTPLYFWRSIPQPNNVYGTQGRPVGYR
eukprot:TRINITY_DN6388_c0_g1_i4.p1 TRINITY_DN6388_c0_g1~~TRINITY_DN6388_c0_g1_i4.p1  ORF type:complete len:547 (+),score=144.70 TRINITY_DN6388_c0_g1_i4:86-1726(+)